MAGKVTDNSNLANIGFIPAGIEAKNFINRARDEQDMFTVLANAGINLLPDANKYGITMEEGRLYKTFKVAEIAGHLGGGVEYNTHIGVKLSQRNIREIEFYTGHEKAFEPFGFDPYTDGEEHRAFLVERAHADWARHVVKDRSKLLFEQIINSAPIIESSDDIKALYNDTGFTDFVAPVNKDNMTPDELLDFGLAISEWFSRRGVSDEIVVTVTPNEWAKIVKDESRFLTFTTMLPDGGSYVNKDVIDSKIRIVENVVFLKSSDIGKAGGEFSKFSRMVLTQGSGTEIFNYVRPIGWDETNKPLQKSPTNEYADNVTYGLEYYGGTYQQIVMLMDNFDDQLTDSYLIFVKDGETFEQNIDVVLKAHVLGSKPGISPFVNRTVRKMIDGEFDNELGDEISEVTSDGSFDGHRYDDAEMKSVKEVMEEMKREMAKVQAENRKLAKAQEQLRQQQLAEQQLAEQAVTETVTEETVTEETVTEETVTEETVSKAKKGRKPSTDKE